MNFDPGMDVHEVNEKLRLKTRILIVSPSIIALSNWQFPT